MKKKKEKIRIDKKGFVFFLKIKENDAQKANEANKESNLLRNINPEKIPVIDIR